MGRARVPGWAGRSGPRLAGLVLAAALPVLTSCGGSDAAPVEQVPVLGDRLAKVDEAVEAGDYPKVRAAVRELVAEVAEAQVDGKLTDDQATRIVAAARSVLANLPAERS